MKDRLIICISREYGSGGRVIGESLAQRLGINCYDKKLVEKTAQEHGITPETIGKVDEQPATWTSMGFPHGIRNPYKADYDTMYYSLNDRIFNMQKKTIMAIAAEGSCIIVGRVASEILKDDPDMISIFIHANIKNRIKRIMEVDHVDHIKAAELIQKTDKNRATYHNNYSNRKWGVCSSYDFSISTSTFGMEGTINAIIKLLE